MLAGEGAATTAIGFMQRDGRALVLETELIAEGDVADPGVDILGDSAISDVVSNYEIYFDVVSA